MLCFASQFSLSLYWTPNTDKENIIDMYYDCNIVLANRRHLKSNAQFIVLAFSAQHEAYLLCIIAAFLRPTPLLHLLAA